MFHRVYEAYETLTDEERTELSKKYLLELSKTKPIYAIPEEDTIYIDDDKIEFFGSRPYYEFREGVMTMNNTFQLVPYTDEYYDFVYEVKKNAYKKYVEECWGKWDEEAQREYFKKFIEAYKNSAYIIRLNNQDSGFYNDEQLENENMLHHPKLFWDEKYLITNMKTLSQLAVEFLNK